MHAASHLQICASLSTLGRATSRIEADIGFHHVSLKRPEYYNSTFIDRKDASKQLEVFHRTLGSSSTGGLTGYLNKKCLELQVVCCRVRGFRGQFTVPGVGLSQQAEMHPRCPGHWSLGAGSTVSWPTTSAFKNVEGSPGMQKALTDPDGGGWAGRSLGMGGMRSRSSHAFAILQSA